MNSIPQHNLNDLLEQVVSCHVPDDSSHRYALRRALCNSTTFERNRFRIVWTRLFMYTTSFVAGGAMVAVLVVGVLTIELREVDGSSTIVAGQQSVDEQVQVVELHPEQEYSNPDSVSKVEFASFTEQPEVQHILEFARPATFSASTR